MRLLRICCIAMVVASFFLSAGVAAQEEYERTFTTMTSYPLTEHDYGGWESPRRIPGDLEVIPMSRMSANLPSATSGAAIENPVPEIVMGSFVESLNRRREAPGVCARSPWAGSHSGPECDEPKLTVLRTATYQARNAVLVGNIEHLTPGWSTRQRIVISMVYVRVTEVLRDSTGSLAPGSLVVYRQPWGSFEVGGISLCTYPPPGYLSARPFQLGDQVLLAGRHDILNAGNIILHSSLPFHILDGEVVPPSQKLNNCFLPEAVSLETIRQSLVEGQ